MARPGEPMASERHIETTDKQRQALEYRKDGLDYREIAARLNLSVGGAHKAVQTALRKTIQEPADEVRTLEVTRLDTMLRAIAPQIAAGDHGAIDRALKIMERRAKLLGLDAPLKVHTDLMLRGMVERAAAESGLDVAVVRAEAERILSESAT